MQTTEFLFCALFALSVAVTCALPVQEINDLLERPTEKRLTKREAAIFVLDSIPVESVASSKPKRVYKRVSKPRNHAYRYGPKTHDSINNNFQKRHKIKKIKSMFSAPSAKKRSPKTPPKYYVQGKLPQKKVPGGKKPAKRLPRPPIPEFPHPRPLRKPSAPEQWAMSFGEPPSASPPQYEVPVDSYGAPLKTTVIDPNLRVTDIDNYDVQITETGPDYGDWHDEIPSDNAHAFSNNYQAVVSPSKFGKYHNYDDYYRNSYVPRFNDMASHNEHHYHKSVKKGVNKPWMRSKKKEEEEKVLVGGQYAEPPGRYVPMNDPSEKIIFDDSELFSSGDRIHMFDIEPTVSVSPYVNYKNSNMAFSPQNLNDAFSLDK